jgi:hypothetical protein
MTITLAKALKLKNKLTKDIQQVNGRMLQSNQKTDGQKVHFQSDTEYKKLLSLKIKLVEVKRKIAQANSPIWSKIFEIAEMKGTIQTLSAMNASEFERKSYKPDGTEIVSVTTAFIDETEKAKMIEELETEIEALQDEVDTFNAVTKIEIAD